jgi:hypothetical protein
MEHLLRKLQARSRASPRERPCDYHQQDHGAGLSKPFGVHIMPHVSSHGVVGFSACPSGFWSCFANMYLLSIPSFLFFRNGKVYSMSLYMRSI